MPSTTKHYSDPIYNAYTPQYSGVVRIMDTKNGTYGTGALIYDGKAVLTAAHLLDNNPSRLKILFEEDENNNEYRYSSHFLSFSNFTTQSSSSNDLAIFWLEEAAPSFATRYDIYRDNPLGLEFNFSGYGAKGSGNSGVDESFNDTLRIQADNKFEANHSDLPNTYSNSLEIVADFDSADEQDNILDKLVGSSDLGLGEQEGILLSGDSGSPAWVEQKIAAIAKGVTKYNETMDTPYGSFGDIGIWSDITQPLYQQWIDQSLRANYPDAPTSKEEVNTTILEGDDGEISYAYFLVEFLGMRDDESEWISIDFSTRDESALAGVDYISTSGTLILYPDEYSTVIPVEIIGNNTPQEERIFYLDIYNPVGGSFKNGTQILSASRTIIDDDGYFIA